MTSAARVHITHTAQDDQSFSAPGAVVWVSGYSSSGKTTVGRRVEALLREGGDRTIFLDGDELRSIFGERWGYTRVERVELARVYFRLCSHLASQGCSVVIAAVAMYDDARAWLKENVPGAIEIYLDVPEEERRSRDQATKQIYREIGSQADLYDPPTAPDLVVANFGEIAADQAADAIVAFVRDAPRSHTADHGRRRHWSSFYSEASAPEGPSSFATATCSRLPHDMRILEVGCGNGRDAAFFATQGYDVTAIDPSASAIESCRSAQLRGRYMVGDIAVVERGGGFDVVYSRFVLHAMTRVEEVDFAATSHELLKPGGVVLIEARSINDPLARKGEVISRTERIHGHYRRFIILDELVDLLVRHGFIIDQASEISGVAKLGDDDPVVVRIVARKSP